MKLTIKGLSKTYKNGVKAIDRLDLEICSGMFGLLGPNGAGKSSLMRTIATLQHPDEGNIFFNGINVLEDNMSLRKILGYLPQDFGVYPGDSAEKLLDYLAILKGISSKKDRRIKVDEVLELANLHEVRKKSVSTYSGGMKQRFGIAQLLLNDPQLIIVDEPTAGLDPAERKRFLNVLRDIGTDNIVIFSTHLVDDITELCSALAIIDKGRVLLHSTPTEAIYSMEGKVWSITTTKPVLSELSSLHQVLSSGYNEDNSIKVRIYSDDSPGTDFTLEKPQLEDVYFYSLSHAH